MTDFRALCAELLTAIQFYTKLNPAASEMSAFELTEKLMDAMAATNAALAQPKPVAPTDEELEELFYANDNLSKHCEAGTDWSEPLMMRYEFPAVARAVLARWGQP
jgi:hypothetical protein